MFQTKKGLTVTSLKWVEMLIQMDEFKCKETYNKKLCDCSMHGQCIETQWKDCVNTQNFKHKKGWQTLGSNHEIKCEEIVIGTTNVRIETNLDL